jgi:hypothetical protein
MATSRGAISAAVAIRLDEDAFAEPSLTRAFAAKEHSIFDYTGAAPTTQ